MDYQPRSVENTRFLTPISTRIMAPHQVLSSDEEDAPRQAPQRKRTRTSRDDVSGNIELPHRTRKAGERTASAKQQENGHFIFISSRCELTFFNR
jgi:hypothetical protein